jgi:hypothetical protein
MGNLRKKGVVVFGNENGSLILFLILEKLKIKIKRPITRVIINGPRALA